MATHQTGPQFPIVIEVRTQHRPDGGLRVWSDDLRGLILSGRQPSEVLGDIAGAIEELMEAKGYGRVQAGAAHSLPESTRAHSLSYVVTPAA